MSRVPQNLYFKGFLENALCNAKMPFSKMGTTAHKNGYQNAPPDFTKMIFKMVQDF